MSRMRKVVLVILTVLSLLVIGAYAFLQVQLNKVNRITARETVFTAEDFEEDGDPGDALTQVDWGTHTPVTEADGVINVMLVGQDTRVSGQRTRSDTMILLSIDTVNRRLSMTSFLRDLYVQIPGYSDNKLCAAYAFGGFPLLDAAIEQNFGVSVDYNVEVDFQGFRDIIDAVGGIDIRLNQGEVDYLSGATDDGRKHSGTDPISGLQVGINHLDGDAALAYARTRKVNTDTSHDDFGRTERQRTVIQTVFHQLKDRSWLELLSIYDRAAGSLTTDMTNDQILSVALAAYQLGADQIEEYHVPEDRGYTDEWAGSMLVLVPTNWDALRANLQEFLYG